MSLRVIYAAGPGNIIVAHKSWSCRLDDPGQMSLTYSGQFADLCESLGATAYLISSCSDRDLLHDGRFTLEHRPKLSLGRGVMYHVSETLYGLGILWTAIRFRAQVAVISSDATHYFVLSLFRLFGISVISVLHNTLWPKGFRPAGWRRLLLAKLDGLFFRKACGAVVGVSDECTRQITELCQGKPPKLYVMQPQFRREYFESIKRAPPLSEIPFKIIFAGRIESNKGVFDILKIAQEVNRKFPARMEWHICGIGSDLVELRRRCSELQLEACVKIHGWTSPVDLRNFHGTSHMSIVPTRSNFAEGLAKSAVEAILAGRPVLVSSVTPAHEALAPASIEVQVDDIQGYVDALSSLIQDEARYSYLLEASATVQSRFYDRKMGFESVLKQALRDLKSR